jgi:hypothetical protein
MAYDCYVRHVERIPSVQKDLALNLKAVAHHEAGHIVIAAARNLRLGLDGLSIDSLGEGIACYCKRPDETDLSRESVILATFAGFKAQRRFCEGWACPAPDPSLVPTGARRAMYS